MRPLPRRECATNILCLSLLLLAAWGAINQIDLVSPAFECRWFHFISFHFSLYFHKKRFRPLLSLHLGHIDFFVVGFWMENYWRSEPFCGRRESSCFIAHTWRSSGCPSGTLSWGSAMEFRGFGFLSGHWEWRPGSRWKLWFTFTLWEALMTLGDGSSNQKKSHSVLIGWLVK